MRLQQRDVAGAQAGIVQCSLHHRLYRVGIGQRQAGGVGVGGHAFDPCQCLVPGRWLGVQGQAADAFAQQQALFIATAQRDVRQLALEDAQRMKMRQRHPVEALETQHQCPGVQATAQRLHRQQQGVGRGGARGGHTEDPRIAQPLLQQSRHVRQRMFAQIGQKGRWLIVRFQAFLDLADQIGGGAQKHRCARKRIFRPAGIGCRRAQVPEQQLDQGIARQQRRLGRGLANGRGQGQGRRSIRAACLFAGRASG